MKIRFVRPGSTKPGNIELAPGAKIISQKTFDRVERESSMPRRAPVLPRTEKRECAYQSSRNQIKFLQQLHEWREAAGFSQQELADLLGVEIEWVKEIERIDSNPTLSDLRQYLTQCKTVLFIQAIGVA